MQCESNNLIPGLGMRTCALLSTASSVSLSKPALYSAASAVTLSKPALNSAASAVTLSSCVAAVGKELCHAMKGC